MSVWWLMAAVFFGVFWIFAATLAFTIERARRRLWQRRARKARAEVIDLTGMRSRFGDAPAGAHRPKISVRERSW